MEYPLIVSGEQAGTLTVEKEGLFTLFEAQCSNGTELLRLSVYGEGKEGYLGIMEPWSGGLFLRRRLSRTQLRGFPERIEYAAQSGEKANSEAISKTPAVEKENTEGGLCWYRCKDGSLICKDGGHITIALPARLKRPVSGTVLREIEGQLYMLFRY